MSFCCLPSSRLIISDLEKDENEYGEGLGVWRGGGTRLARCPINEGTRINHPTQPTTVIQRHYPLHYLYSFLGMHDDNKRIFYIIGMACWREGGGWRRVESFTLTSQELSSTIFHSCVRDPLQSRTNCYCPILTKHHQVPTSIAIY